MSGGGIYNDWAWADEEWDVGGLSPQKSVDFDALYITASRRGCAEFTQRLSQIIGGPFCQK